MLQKTNHLGKRKYGGAVLDSTYPLSSMWNHFAADKKMCHQKVKYTKEINASYLRTSFQNFNLAGIDLGLQRLTLSWKRDLPDFSPDVEASSESLNMTSSHEEVPGRIVLQSVRKPPTHSEVREWLKAKGFISTKLKEKESKQCLDVARKTGAVVSESDSDVSDFDEESAPNKSQIVVRVRRDSEDSLGSEISCSPPSPSKQEELNQTKVYV